MTTSSLAQVAAARSRFAFAPHLALLTLLLGEVLYLTISFDTRTLDQVPHAWARLIGWSPQVLRLATAIAGVMLLVSGKKLWAVLQRSSVNPQWPYFLLAHLAGVGLFGVVSATVMSPGFPAVGNQGPWALAWLLSGTFTIVMWALAVLPASTWRVTAIEGRWGLVAGAVAGTAVWAGGFLTEEFWGPLSGYTFAVVRWMVALIYTDVFADPVSLEVGTSAFNVRIAPSCSGYEGIGLIVAFLSVYLWLSRKTLRFPNALVLLPIGAAAVWILNAVRIAVLIVIGTSGWRDVALGGFHSQAGWLAFNAVGLGLVAITMRGRYFSTNVTRSQIIEGDPDPTAAYLGPFLAIVAASMVTGAMSAGFDWLYPVRVIAAGAVIWTFRKTYSDMRWSWSWQAIAIGAVTFAIWLALLPAEAGGKDGWTSALGAIHPAWAGLWLAIRVLGYVVTVPVAEELAFRSYLMRRLTHTEFHRVAPGDFAWIPWIVSSVLFGAMHGSMWIAGTIAGLLFGFALFRRRSLGDAVQAHATTNLLLVIYAAVTGHWSAWS